MGKEEGGEMWVDLSLGENEGMKVVMARTSLWSILPSGLVSTKWLG